MYGLCKDSSGAQFTSCYSVSSSASLTTVVTASGTYTVAAKNTDYSFSSVSSCNLDEANGSKLNIDKLHQPFSVVLNIRNSNLRSAHRIYAAMRIKTHLDNECSLSQLLAVFSEHAIA